MRACAPRGWLRSRQREPGSHAILEWTAITCPLPAALRAELRSGLLVDFEPMDFYARVGAYFGLLDELRTLLEGNADLVMVGAVKNPYIARSRERTKQQLHAA
jgi:hypothetical protein